MTDFEHARLLMIESQLRTSGVLEKKILSAMNAVPREVFLEGTARELAYLDRAHKYPGTASRFMGAPASFAKLLDFARIGEDEIVLDVACGWGYSTAVIAHLANSVVAVESDADMVTQAGRILAELDIGNAAIINTDLDKGAPQEAPFDVILIEGAVEIVPESLLSQLRIGGRLLCIAGEGGSASVVLHTRNKSGFATVHSAAAPLPVLLEMARPLEFSF